MHAEIGNYFAVSVDDFIEHIGVALRLLPATGSDNQAFDIKLVGANQLAYHGLFVVGVGAEVGGVDDPWLFSSRPICLARFR